MQKPEKGPEAIEIWEFENALIMSWLINSMEPSISKAYKFLATFQEIWEAKKETFSDLGNSAQVYAISTQIRNSKQGNTSVLQYYNALIYFMTMSGIVHKTVPYARK